MAYYCRLDERDLGADLFSARAENELASELTRFREETGVALEVVTVRMSDMDGETTSNYARHLFEVRQNGEPGGAPRVLFVATAFAEGGRLEIARSASVRATFTPAMVAEIGNGVITERRGTHDMGTAVTHGLRRTERLFAPVNGLANEAQPVARTHASPWSMFDWMILGTIAAAAIALLWIFVAWRRSRRRSRRGHGRRMDLSGVGESLVEVGEAGLQTTAENLDMVVKAGNAIDVSGFADTVGNLAQSAAEGIGDAAGSVVDAAGDALSNIDVSGFGDD